MSREDHLKEIAHDLMGCVGIFMALEPQLKSVNAEVHEIFVQALARLEKSVVAMRNLPPDREHSFNRRR